MENTISQLVGEFMGTFILVLLGNGVVSGVLLAKSKAENAGWVAISIGWGLALMLAIYIGGFLSLGHFNPAITLAMFAIGKIGFSLVVPYILAQFLGALTASMLLVMFYYPHYEATKDPRNILASFATSPQTPDSFSSVFGEALATAILVIGVIAVSDSGLNPSIAPIVIGLLLTAIGLSLGGTTGFAVNPARDLAPRLIHFLMPIPNKGDSNWQYAWVPVLAPILGGVAGAIIYHEVLALL